MVCVCVCVGGGMGVCGCERKELWKERQNTVKQIEGKSFKSSIWSNRENRAGEASSLQLARLSPMTWGWSTGFVLRSSLQAHRDACSSLLASNTCRLTSRTYTKPPQESNGVKSTEMTTTTGAGGYEPTVSSSRCMLKKRESKNRAFSGRPLISFLKSNLAQMPDKKISTCTMILQRLPKCPEAKHNANKPGCEFEWSILKCTLQRLCYWLTDNLSVTLNRYFFKQQTFWLYCGCTVVNNINQGPNQWVIRNNRGTLLSALLHGLQPWWMLLSPPALYDVSSCETCSFLPLIISHEENKLCDNDHHKTAL